MYLDTEFCGFIKLVNDFETVNLNRFRFEARLNLSLATLMSFLFFLKFSILSPLNEMNRFTLEQRWIILETYFQNKVNWAEIDN